MNKTYDVAGFTFELKPDMPIEDVFLVAVDTVNHYMIEDAAAGELYAHPLLRQAWCTQMFLQYHTTLDVTAFEAEGRKPIFSLLEWVENHNVLVLDEDMMCCYARFNQYVMQVEQTMLDRFAQRNSAGNQLRKLLNFIQLRDENGNGGWEELRNVIAEHMLDEQDAQRKGHVVDMRMFGKMKDPKPQ